MKNISRNIAYQGIFQIVKTILPFLAIPIVSHSLGAAAVGEYNFYNSIIQYFILMAALGIPLYGVREVAKNRDNENKLATFFSELQLLNITLAIAVAVLAAIIGFLLKYPAIYFVQIILIIGSGLDISWFFMGVEDFSKVTIANTIIAIISVLVLYFNVHTSADLLFYSFLMSVSTVIGQIIPWLFIRKYVKRNNVRIKNVYKHIKHTYILFFPQVSILIYTVVNKIILGFFAGNVAVAVYSNSMLIVSSLVVLIGVVDTAFLPRVSYQAKTNNYAVAAKTLNNILQIQGFVNIGIIFGVLAISRQFIPWFFGKSFYNMETILPVLIPSIFFITAGTSLSRQFFVPTDKLRPYNLIVFCGALLSILLNFVSIPILETMGAALTTVLVEMFLWTIEIVYFFRITGKTYYWNFLIKNFIAGICMYLTIVILTGNMKSSIITTFLQVFIGVLVYFALNHALRGNFWLRVLKK